MGVMDEINADVFIRWVLRTNLQAWWVASIRFT